MSCLITKRKYQGKEYQAQIKPVQTIAAAIIAEMPFKNIFPPRTMPSLVVCVALGVLVLVPVPASLEVGADEDGEGEAEVDVEVEADERMEKAPPATSSGVVEFAVLEAARA